MDTIRPSTGEALIARAGNNTRELEINGTVYVLIYQENEGDFKDLSGIDTKEITTLAKSILSAHTATPTLKGKEISYINHTGAHFVDDTVSSHSDAHTEDTWNQMMQALNRTHSFINIDENSDDSEEELSVQEDLLTRIPFSSMRDGSSDEDEFSDYGNNDSFNSYDQINFVSAWDTELEEISEQENMDHFDNLIKIEQSPKIYTLYPSQQTTTMSKIKGEQPAITTVISFNELREEINKYEDANYRPTDKVKKAFAQATYHIIDNDQIPEDVESLKFLGWVISTFNIGKKYMENSNLIDLKLQLKELAKEG